MKTIEITIDTMTRIVYKSITISPSLGIPVQNTFENSSSSRNGEKFHNNKTYVMLLFQHLQQLFRLLQVIGVTYSFN